jgi:hypothetical protein
MLSCSRRRFERAPFIAYSRKFCGIVGGLHQFTAMNQAWRPDVGLGSEFLRLEVRDKLLSCLANDGFGCRRRSGECVRGRIGIECCCAYGVRFCMWWIRVPREFQFVGGGVTPPGKQVLCLVSASMAGSCTDVLSCIFVGPIETAEKARLEALHQQARDSYYSG